MHFIKFIKSLKYFIKFLRYVLKIFKEYSIIIE